MGCLYSVIDCSSSSLKPVQCSCCQNKSAGRGVEVVVGVADECATAPHAQSVRIISGGGLDRKWQKYKYYKVFTRIISVTMMINVLFTI